MEYSKESIVKLLMKRDNMDEEEARSWVEETQAEITALEYSPDATLSDVEDVISSNLGLEPDYLADFLSL